MVDIIKPDFGGKKEDFEKEVYRLLLFYRQVYQILENVFRGSLFFLSGEVNTNYLRLCTKVEEILKKPGFEDLSRLNWRPFQNLLSLDPDAPDAEWEYGGQQTCGDFLSAIEEVYIGTGEKVFPLNINDQQLLSEMKNYLNKYIAYKKEREAVWLQNLKKISQDSVTERNTKFPQFDFKFIGDSIIRNLLSSDWEEAKKAFDKGLYKSAVILCGTVIETLLIDALSSIKGEANSSFYQKYLAGKKKEEKPPEIEYWQMYQLIEVAKQHGIIGTDAAKLTHYVKDYRNLIHLFAQKRDSLNVTVETATAVISFLNIAYKNILEWQEKKDDF